MNNLKNNYQKYAVSAPQCQNFALCCYTFAMLYRETMQMPENA